MRSKPILVVLFLAASAAFAQQPSQSTAVPAPSQPLTLDQAFARALEANQSVARAALDVSIADEQRRIALSRVLPHLSASGNVTRNSTQVTFGGGDSGNDVTILPENDWSYRITLTQPIYAGRRELRAYDQAKLNIANTRESLSSAQDRLLLGVAADYLAVVQGDQLISVEKQNVDLATQRLKQSRDFYEAGEVTRVDVLRAQAAVKAAERQLTGARQARDTAAGRLRIDLNLDGAIAVSDPSLALRPVPGEEEMIGLAEASRPEIAQARNYVRMAKLEIQKQRGAYLPTVTADAAFINQKSQFPASEYGQAALRVTVPIFQGGEFAARVATAKEQEKQAQLALSESRQIVREDVRKSLLDLRSAETTLALAREEADAAEAEYKQVFELYRAQEATSLDLQSAESSLADARRAVVNTTLDLDLARLRVWYAAGALKNVALGEEKHS
ncbi:MAG: TolC family protein [Thermoanaerobaculia bacterium]